MFLGRPIRTEISLASPNNDNDQAKSLQSNLSKKAVIMADNFNKRNGSKVCEYQIGDFVYFSGRNIRGETFWTEGVIQSRRGAVSYRVLGPNGDKHMRHVNQLRDRVPSADVEIPHPPVILAQAPASDPPKTSTGGQRYPLRVRRPVQRFDPAPGKKNKPFV